jgi:hypothetical protein
VRRGKFALAGLAAAAALAAVSLPLAAPARGDDYASKKIWQLEFEYGMPKRITLGLEPNIENYWYLPFTLKNPDEQDHSFFLEISAVSDKNYTYRNIAQAQVRERVRRRLGIRPGEKFWTAEDVTTAHEPTDVNAPFPRSLDLPVIKAGETVKCAAIFNGWDREMDRLTITIRGLTNDVIVTKTAPHERKLSERVLQLMYERPGDEYYRSEDPVEFVGRQWTTIERTIKTDLE